MRNIKAILATVAMLALAGPQAAFAIDAEPADYTPLPSGTSAMLLYYQNTQSKSFNMNDTEIPGSKLSVNVGNVRFLHYSELWGRPVGFQAYLPFGAFSDAEVGGSPLTKAGGIGDLTVGATIWPVAAAPTDLHGTTLGVSLLASVPTGDYTPGGANLGNGGVVITPQIGLIQGLGGGRFLDATYDVSFTKDFTSNGASVSVKPRHQAQLWLRQQLSAASYVALGYNGLRGSDLEVNGVATGSKTSSDQIRFSAGHFIDQTTQISGRVSYDVNTKDGFASKPTFQLRYMKLF